MDDETYRKYVEQEPSESQSKIHCRSQNGVFGHVLWFFFDGNLASFLGRRDDTFQRRFPLRKIPDDDI